MGQSRRTPSVLPIWQQELDRLTGGLHWVAVVFTVAAIVGVLRRGVPDGLAAV